MKKLSLLLFCLTAFTLSTLRAGEYNSESLSSTAVQVATGPVNVEWLLIINPNSVPIFVHKWDALAANVTVGTTAQKNAPWPIAANGFLWLPKNSQAHGFYSTALTIAATTTATTAGTTAPSSNLIVSIGYK